MYGDETHGAWTRCKHCGQPAVRGWSNPEELCDKCKVEWTKKVKDNNG